MPKGQGRSQDSTDAPTTQKVVPTALARDHFSPAETPRAGVKTHPLGPTEANQQLLKAKKGQYMEIRRLH